MTDKPTEITPGLAGYRNPSLPAQRRQLARKDDDTSLALMFGVPLVILVALTGSCGVILYTLRWFWEAAG